VPTVELPILKNGLLVDVVVGASAPLRERLYMRNAVLPQPVHCTLLVDTGCDSTLINGQAIRSLGVPATSETRVITATTGPNGERCKVYVVELQLLPSHHQAPAPRSIEVLERELLNQGIDGLLGRDILSTLVLEYDGPRRLARFNW
jgi:predicted aspartyl protease